MRVLHVGPDLLGGRHARRGAGWLAEPRYRRCCDRAAAHPRRNRRADERQSLSLRGLSQHRRGHPFRGREECGMRPFTYERAADVRAATAAGAAPGVRFIAGGTNLLDLMKLEIE